MKIKTLSVMLLTGLACGQAWADVTVIPTTALVYSTQYYTEMAGVTGGLGSTVIMTGGGNAPNIGGSSGRNDDGYSGPISFNFSTQFSLFGASYSNFFANNNGNITFTNGLAAFSPDIFNYPVGVNTAIIAPFFADADTRYTGSGVMHLNQSVAEQTIVTWDSVGYYNNNEPVTLFNSFQLVVRGAGYTVGAGEGTIGFFWKTMGWDTGSRSGGNGGQSGPFGYPAAVGLGDGLPYGPSNSYVLDFSMTDTIETVVENHHIWFNVNSLGGLEVVPPAPPPAVPEPETYAMLLAGLGLMGVTARRRKRSA